MKGIRIYGFIVFVLAAPGFAFTATDGAELASYKLIDLGPDPKYPQIPEYPSYPKLDGTGSFQFRSINEYQGPQITSSDPRYAHYEPYQAYLSATAGSYQTGYLQRYDGSAAFLSDGTHAWTLPPVSGPVSPWQTIDYAYGVNARGQVVGATATGQNSGEAFLADLGQKAILLGTLGGPRSSAMAINDRGQVVGRSATAEGWDHDHAFLYQDGVMTDLNTLIPGGVTLSFATDIDADGNILAVGRAGSGDDHIYLLQPQAVPEPVTWALWSTVIVLGIGYRSFRRSEIRP
jgi:probable HAF family extracellular repeat protein